MHVAELERELARHEAVHGEAEVQVASEASFAQGLAESSERFHADLLSEETALQEVRTARQACGPAATAAAQAASKRAVETELREVHERYQNQQTAAASAMARIGTLRAELATERREREELGQTLRKAVAQQAGDPSRAQVLEAAIAARGGDAHSVATGGGASEMAGQQGEERIRRVEALQSELKEYQERCTTQRSALERAKDQGAQAVERLQASLDKARADLQSSMRDAAMTQGAEVSRLQSEVQSARQHAADEALAERLQADRHAQQQEATQRALEQQSAALRDMPPDIGGEPTMLLEELRRVRVEMDTAEQRLASAKERAVSMNVQRLSIQGEGSKRVAKVRRMIQDLWDAIGAQDERADNDFPSPATRRW